MLTTSVADKIATRLWDLCGSLITKQPSTPSGVSWWSFSILSTNHLCLWKQGQVYSSCHVVYKPFLKKFSVPTENLEIIESLCHHLRTSRTSMIYVITLPWWKISVQRVWELFSWMMRWEISTTEKNHIDRWAKQQKWAFKSQPNPWYLKTEYGFFLAYWLLLLQKQVF